MIYCGSGSSFGKVSVPVPAPVPVPDLVPDPDYRYIGSFLTTKKLVQNIIFSMSEVATFPRKLASQF